MGREVGAMTSESTGIQYELSRTYSGPPEALFHALTNPVILKRIWGVQDITVDARAGGQAVAMFVVGEQDWSFTITYTELALDAGRMRWVARFKNFPSKETRVTVLLKRDDSKTTLTLRMENF